MPHGQLVWFKRDLRVDDHAPLFAAAARGPLLPLYIVEPSVIQADDFSARHWTFIRASLSELRAELASRGQPLIVRVGEAIAVFTALRQQHSYTAIWAHEETGNAITYARDRAVRRWARAQGVALHELPQHGVVRRLASRDNWAGLWEQRMRQPLVPTPSTIQPVGGIAAGEIPNHADLDLEPDLRLEQQPGGATNGQTLLETFLHQRGKNYTREMSSPLTAWDACSRLSPHLAWGTLSIRQVAQAGRAQAAALREERANSDRRAVPITSDIPTWLRSLQSFDSRLHWHCHFMQKLEDEPAIEFHNFVRAYDGMREDAFNQAAYAAWSLGQTGYPMIDAAMRAMIHTGWLNFRMRAMLVSFAAYDLWLHWRSFHPYLARIWSDYEVGIHLCQLQMQSGTTGINTVRIYNPVKQSHDQDPEGLFIRRWVPELAAVPNSFIHTPWLMPSEQQRALGCVIGKQYPAPIVDHAPAAAQAKAKLAAVRRKPETHAQANAVQEKHGSRMKKPAQLRRQEQAKRQQVDDGQMELGL